MSGIVDSIFGKSRSDTPGKIRYIPFPDAASQIGIDRTFSSPRLSVSQGGFTGTGAFEPELLGARNKFLGQTDSVRKNLSGIRGRLDSLRQEFTGNQNAFINARVNPLRASIAQQRGNLRQDLGRRGVQGSLGNRELSGFNFDAQRALGDAEALATADALTAQQGILRQQQGIDENLANMFAQDFAARTGVNEQLFTRELQGLGIGSDTLLNLLSLAGNLSTSSGNQAVRVGQLNDAAAQNRRSNIGNTLMAIGGFF